MGTTTELQELMNTIRLIQLTNYGIGKLLLSACATAQLLNLATFSLLLHVSWLRYSIECSVRGESSFIRSETIYVDARSRSITSGGTTFCLPRCS